MEIIKMNSGMRELYSPDWDLSSVTLPRELTKTIEYGIVEHQGCFVFRDAMEANPHIRVEDLDSRTEYECSINEVCLDTFDICNDTDRLLLAFAFLQKVSDILQEHFSDKTFYGIVSMSTSLQYRGHCVVMFHCKHEGERMGLADDLEGYKIDAVCLIHL